jgi:hypothetical protein
MLIVVTVGAMFRNAISRFVYFPMQYPEGEWGLQAGTGAQDRWLTAADGTRLNAWWFPKSDARFMTLYLHGNGGNVTHRIDHAQAVLSAGSAVFVLDYRGYGKSQGHPSEPGLYEDAEAAYSDLLALGYSPNQIIFHGESLGTAVAVDLALGKPCAALILESPPMSLSKMADTVVPILGPLVVHGYDTYRKIRRLHVPLLVIHGDADEIVPFSQGQAVFRVANQPKYFWRVPGANHNDLLYVAGSDYEQHLTSFYESVLERRNRGLELNR